MPVNPYTENRHQQLLAPSFHKSDCKQTGYTRQGAADWAYKTGISIEIKGFLKK